MDGVFPAAVHTHRLGGADGIYSSITDCLLLKFIKPKSFLLGNPLLALHSSEAFQLLNHLLPHWSCTLHVVLCIYNTGIHGY